MAELAATWVPSDWQLLLCSVTLINIKLSPFSSVLLASHFIPQEVEMEPCSDLRKQRLPFGSGQALSDKAGPFAVDVGIDVPWETSCH